MSARNKLENKSIRRDEREAQYNYARRPLGTMAVSVEDARALLTDPKEKLSAPTRRYLKRALAQEVSMRPPVRPADQFARKLASLKLTQVIRRRSQFAARAAGAKYKLAALSPDSRFRLPLQRAQDFNLHAFKMAQAEISARMLVASQSTAVFN